MHTLAERHQDGRGGRATVSPGPSDGPFNFRTYREHLDLWILCRMAGHSPVEWFETWKVRAYKTP